MTKKRDIAEDEREEVVRFIKLVKELSEIQQMGLYLLTLPQAMSGKKKAANER